MSESQLDTRQKALAVNLDPASYGTIAEIGGGQEVARWFFHVGGAAGSLAKSISAYDMSVSDALYGRAQRYVSRERLRAMLEHEYAQLLERLADSRGDKTTFFAFADTVATRSYKHPGDGRGWLGIRFQTRPGEQPSEILVHVNLFDSTAVLQQNALGILGVNLIHGAFFQHADPGRLIGTLLDDLSRARLDIDMIRFAGPAFSAVDNRLMSLQLVQNDLTDAAMFTATGEVVQPSEVLYKRPVLVQRGSFRPVTKLTLDVLDGARQQFIEEPEVKGREPLLLMEMTLRDLGASADIDHADFLARADILGCLGLDVLISRFEQYYRLADYLAAYTEGPIGLAATLQGVQELAVEQPSAELAGGIIEATGRIFKRSVRMYVYPVLDAPSGKLRGIDAAPVPSPWHHLRDLLLETGRLVPMRQCTEEYLSIDTADVLARIQAGDASWETMVPAAAVTMIKAKQLLGYRAVPVTSAAS